MTPAARVTVAVPSFNQGGYLDQALASIFAQDVPVEVFVVDGGSTDDSLEVIRRWGHRLAGWRSHPDAGQAAAINEAIARGTAPFVTWINSDDLLLAGGLSNLLVCLEQSAIQPAAYGRAWHQQEPGGARRPVWVRPFSAPWLAQGCFICQPATLIRRSAWEAVGGLDETLHMAMDYDLWWRLYRAFGPLAYIDTYLAVNREHATTKTRTQRRAHYREAMAVVRRHYGRVPMKWWLAQPYAVWWRSIFG
jgi:glycosyltransferase involved in cell wall biosynthesis